MCMCVKRFVFLSWFCFFSISLCSVVHYECDCSCTNVIIELKKGRRQVNEKLFKLQCGIQGWCKKERRQDQDGLYTRCSWMSDRITLQAENQQNRPYIVASD